MVERVMGLEVGAGLSSPTADRLSSAVEYIRNIVREHLTYCDKLEAERQRRWSQYRSGMAARECASRRQLPKPEQSQEPSEEQPEVAIETTPAASPRMPPAPVKGEVSVSDAEYPRSEQLPTAPAARMRRRAKRPSWSDALIDEGIDRIVDNLATNSGRVRREVDTWTEMRRDVLRDVFAVKDRRRKRVVNRVVDRETGREVERIKAVMGVEAVRAAKGKPVTQRARGSGGRNAVAGAKAGRRMPVLVTVRQALRRVVAGGGSVGMILLEVVTFTILIAAATRVYLGFVT